MGQTIPDWLLERQLDPTEKVEKTAARKIAKEAK